MNVNNGCSNIPPQFMGLFDGTTIYRVDGFGVKTPIGVSQQAYDELQEICNGYYEKLVELGAIVPPKTAEQLQAESMATMQEMLKQMQALQKEVEALKNERAGNSSNAGTKPAENTAAYPGVGAGAAALPRGNKQAGRA